MTAGRSLRTSDRRSCQPSSIDPQENRSDDSWRRPQASPRPSGPRPRRTAGAACGPSRLPNYGSCATISRRRSAAPSRSPLALRSSARSKRAWMVGRIGGDARLERGRVAETGGLRRRDRAGRGRRRPRGRWRPRPAACRASAGPARARRRRAGSAPGRRSPATDSGSALQHGGETLARRPARSPASSSASPSATSASVVGRAGRAGDPLDERLDLALGQRADEAVDRLAVGEGDHRRDRLDAELAGDRPDGRRCSS